MRIFAVANNQKALTIRGKSECLQSKGKIKIYVLLVLIKYAKEIICSFKQV